MDGAGPEDLDSLARDWITLWQSELAALATDREVMETWIRLLSLWAGFASAGLRAAPRAQAEDEPYTSRPAGETRAAPPRPPPDARCPVPDGPASGDREPLLATILERLETIERRLAALEPPPSLAPRPGRPAARRPRKTTGGDRPGPD